MLRLKISTRWFRVKLEDPDPKMNLKLEMRGSPPAAGSACVLLLCSVTRGSPGGPGRRTAHLLQVLATYLCTGQHDGGHTIAPSARGPASRLKGPGGHHGPVAGPSSDLRIGMCAVTPACTRGCPRPQHHSNAVVQGYEHAPEVDITDLTNPHNLKIRVESNLHC